MCRHDPVFRETMAGYDHLLPDGMPLVWCLNRAGAGLRDRVYGRAHARLGDHHLASANLLQAYDSDGVLRLRTEEMADFSVLVQNGFFTTLENLEIY